MLKETQVIAFEGGQLRVLPSDETGHEAVLALPLSRLLVKMVRVPADASAEEVALPILQSLSPFPDDALTVSCETVREDEEGKVVIAAALPESAADDIGEALDAAKFNVVRIDSLVLGQLRGIWSALGESAGRRLVLVRTADCISMVVLDGDQPSAIRAVTNGDELRREVVLSLLEAEDFGGARKLEEIAWVQSPDACAEDDFSSEQPTNRPTGQVAELSLFAPVRKIEVGADAALVGVGERSDDPGALNALPASWREVLEETRFKAKMVKYLAIAGGIWLLAMGVLFGVPVAYGFLTDRQKDQSKQHARQYKAVKDMKAKVDVIHKYSDHARGALEIMKAISDRLPEGVTLSSWYYKREDGVVIKGEAESAEAVYALKDAMDALAAGEDEDAEKIFGEVELKGPNASRSKNMYTFDLSCFYAKEDEAE